MIFLPKTFNFPVCFLDLSDSHFMSVFCIFEILIVIVILDNLWLYSFLNMTIFSFILFIEQSKLSDCFLKVSQLFLCFFDCYLYFSKSVTVFIDSSIKFIVLVLITLNLFPQNFLLELKLLMISFQLSQPIADIIIVFS